MSKTVMLFFGLCFVQAGCAANYNKNGGGGGGNYSSQAQGVYLGIISTGYSLVTVITPNDSFYGIYTSPQGIFLGGLITGQGQSGNGTYTASVDDFNLSGTINSGNIQATYVEGTSLNGTFGAGTPAVTFTETPLPASSFNYDTRASLSGISGTWTGTLLDTATATVTIDPDGSVSGSSAGCSFTGTVAPDSSNKNFFDVSLTFSGSCAFIKLPTESGIAIDYVLPDGVTHQLFLAVAAGLHEADAGGTVFAAKR